jgi:hypothetical protein
MGGSWVISFRPVWRSEEFDEHGRVGILGLLLIGWGRTEVDDWMKLRSIWKRFGNVVGEKRE